MDHELITVDEKKIVEKWNLKMKKVRRNDIMSNATAVLAQAGILRKHTWSRQAT